MRQVHRTARMQARNRISNIALAAALLCAAALGTWIAPAWAQQHVVIDEAVRAGALTCYRSIDNPLEYYYAINDVHLAQDESGKPAFMFMRYVNNVRSGASDAEAREGTGGGLVHCVVQLGVPPEIVADARRELSRIKSGAKLVGPLNYTSGTFALVAAAKDAEGKTLFDNVVGLGSAPILDGGKAAVSIPLTKQGAKILWESFRMAKPAIDFKFEMDVSGYNSPHRALIEANFDQIYEHKAFAIGVASKYLAAEIKGAFDDLQREGAIKLTQVGGDEKQEQLITTAYNKLTEMMFAPAGGTGTPDLASLTGSGNQPSMLDRATQYLRQNQQDARAENERVRAENRQIREENRRDAAPATASGSGTPAVTAGAGGAGDSTAADRPRGYRPRPPSLEPTYADQARPTDTPRTQPVAQRQEEDVPAFAVLASFEMKSVRQRGNFKIDLNKYTAATRTYPFTSSITGLTSYMNDPLYFKEINMDDPLYKQRELVVMVDGANATDFGTYINFATVQMRKKHQSGEESQDEVRIDRKNFNAEGNAFKLMYGWKGDNDRRRWMDYEYQTTWSFFGGKEQQDPWKNANTGALNVVPPFQKRSVDVDADPDAMTKAGVRVATVKLYYKLGDTEKVKIVTLNALKGKLSERIDFITPPDQLNYEYEVDYQLKGSKTFSTGRKTASAATLILEDVPAAG
jgi:hypothetical protein